MTKRLERFYGQHHLHFITCSCYGRCPLLDTPRKRDVFVGILNEVRVRYRFGLIGYVVMPGHVHLLISEPALGTPSTVMQVLKQRVAHRLLVGEGPAEHGFWQPRFYDFNVWTHQKRNEKLNYMHMNPVKGGLVTHPSLWAWSSYRSFHPDAEGGGT